MLTILQVRNDLLSKIAIEDPTQANALAIQDVVLAINGALQVLQTAGQDFFTRVTIAPHFIAGTALVPLGKSVQAVLGNGRWNNSIALRALSSRGELDQFDRIFLGNPSQGAATGVPMAYFVENLRDGDTGDVDLINIYLAPRPALAGDLFIDVIPDAPFYSAADFTAGTAIIPVAQGYQESVFLPIARWNMTRSSQFSRPDIVAQLQADHTRALETLASVGGSPNAVQPSLPRKAES